jgi:thiamine transport system ATP-binding protein
LVIMAAPGLHVAGLTVRFGAQRALDGADQADAPGEIVAVLGPSACGKSTLLRTRAGLEHADAGTITWDGDDLRATPPHQRGFGLMFQDHALFPHRDVADNVAFGLRMRAVDTARRRHRTREMLHLVGLDGYGPRRVDTLSGGEAQRVALARALAPSPRLLMLDEPLGSLDRALRERLAGELRTLLHELGQAAIHVTHDQDEALTVADRLVVMRAGRMLRDGAPAAVWRDPRRSFVARFLGHENVLDADAARALGIGDGATPVLVPETAIALREHDGSPTVIDAVVEDVQFRGARSRVTVRTKTHGVALVVHTSRAFAAGDPVCVAIDPGPVTPLDPD